MAFLKGALAGLPVAAVVAGLLLGAAGLIAGAWHWPTAWAFLAIYGGGSALGSGLLAVLRPESFRVRQQGLVARAEKRQPVIDAVALLVYLAFNVAWVVFIPLDVFRLKLLPPPAAAVRAAGLAALVAGLLVVHLAIGQNRFAAPTIHDQSAEGQHVVQTGLYGLVRHPFYAGMLLVYAGAASWLGSSAATAACLAFLLMTLARIVIEERYLRRHLPAYAAYARRVRSVLIPGLL